MKGFLIYALGHRNYYHMAETLAASILFNAPQARIAIVCDEPDNIFQRQLFSDIICIEVQQPMIFNNYTVQMYQHSPFEETIKLDADMIWLNGRNPMALFDQMETYDVHHMNRGHGWGQGNSVWTDEEGLKEAYKVDESAKLYKIYGEFVYFKKSKVAEQYFKTVKSVYRKPKVKMTSGFANGTFTDELAYQIASMLKDMEHIDNFTPVLNKYLGYKHLHHAWAYQLPETFYAYSIGGNETPSFMKDQYNILAKHYYHQLGLQNPYQVRDKRTWLPERKKR
jgi:hypothetical protein